VSEHRARIELATRSDIGYCIRVRPSITSTLAAVALALCASALVWAHARAQDPLQDDAPLHAPSPAAIPSAGAILPEDVQLLCERARAVMSNTPGTFVESIDGIFYEGDVPPEDAGCLIVVSGSWSDLEGSGDPIERLVEILSADGWKEDAESSGEGPDGTAITLTKGAVACRIHGQWDVGDDTDSTYVPSDVYQVIVRCERIATEPLLKDAD
jgi:hypothetical protein